MNEYLKVVQPKFAVNPANPLFYVDVKGLIRDGKIELSTPILPLIFIEMTHGYTNMHITSDMFFVINGVNTESGITYTMNSGTTLYKFDYMEEIARRLNQYETMNLLKRFMIDDCKRINEIVANGGLV